MVIDPHQHPIGRRRLRRRAVIAAAVLGLTAVGCTSTNPTSAGPATTVGAGSSSGTAITTKAEDWAPVEAAIGKSGSLQAGGVFRIGMPRADLVVTIGDVALKPTFALGSYAAFVPHDATSAMMMGDLVLTEDEVGPVTTKLAENGITETAVHNHLVGETPRIMYLHYMGTGNAVALARALHDALALTNTPLPGPGPAATPPDPGLDTAMLDQALGRTGKNTGGVRQYLIGRAEPVTLGGMSLPPATGVATVLNFEATGDGQAAVTGDFALLPTEVTSVLAALRDGTVKVTALHSHMIDDSPHLIYAHFYAHDDPAHLARVLRDALAKTDSAKP
jgi:hypothetical protein